MRTRNQPRPSVGQELGVGPNHLGANTFRRLAARAEGSNIRLTTTDYVKGDVPRDTLVEIDVYHDHA